MPQSFLGVKQIEHRLINGNIFWLDLVRSLFPQFGKN